MGCDQLTHKNYPTIMKCLDKVTAQEIPVDLGCLGTSGLTPCNECYECQKRFPIVPLQHCTITIARQVIRNDRVATTRVIQVANATLFGLFRQAL